MSGDNKKSWSGVDGCGSIQGSQVVITTGNSGGGAGGASHDPKNWGDVVVDGKHHSPDMIKALLKERNELAATVEALRDGIAKARDDLSCCNVNSAGERLAHLLEMAPQQHLRDVRAEAGRAGFIAGYNNFALYDRPHAAIEKADKYASSVKDGAE